MRTSFIALLLGSVLSSTAVGTDQGIMEFMACLDAKGASIGSAHRGGPAPGYPENAIATLERGRLAGVRVFEIDVARASDGTLYLMHDKTLERTTTGEGPVTEISADGLSELRLEDNAGAPTSYQIPTLAEALRWAKKNDSFLKIDVKRAATLEELAAVVMAEKADDRVFVILGSIERAKQAEKLMPKAMLSISMPRENPFEAIRDSGLPMNRLVVWAGFRKLDAAVLKKLNELGVYTSFGTLGFGNSYDDRFAAAGDDSLYAGVARDGVDVIATDRPLAVRRGLTAAGLAWDSGMICD